MSKNVKHTPVFRVSYPNVFTKDKYDRYSITAIFNTDEMRDKDIKALEKLEEYAAKVAKEFFKKDIKTLRKNPNFKWPFRDGAEKEGTDGYGEGVVFFSMSNRKKKPNILNRQKEHIYDEDEFYAGCYAIASISCYAYKNEGQGVAFGLNNLFKVKEGASFGFSSKAEDDFEDISEDMLPDDDYEDDDDLV